MQKPKYNVDIDATKSPLSPKENEVIRLSAEGLLKPAIAEELHRSLDTVKTHMRHAFEKLGVHNINQAIAVGFIKGFLKSRDLLLAVLVVNSVLGSVSPSSVYAKPINQWPEQHQQEQQRNKRRGGSRLRHGANAQLRQHTRRKEDNP